MSIQLTLKWTNEGDILWAWHLTPQRLNAQLQQGSLDQLAHDKRRKNFDQVECRLYLPALWFSTISIQVPSAIKKLSPDALKFACEDALAQSVEELHLIPLGKPEQGQLRVLVSQTAQLTEVLASLESEGFLVAEAYSEHELLAADDANELTIQLDEQQVRLCYQAEAHQIHSQGFSEWFDLWAQQHQLASDQTIVIHSDSAEGPAKILANELQASGYQVDWRNRSYNGQWLLSLRAHQSSLNILQGAFRPKRQSNSWRPWLPVSLAACVTMLLLLIMALLTNQQLKRQVDQTWAASEAVFLQVFGAQKRIQRPLMVREMRALAAGNTGIAEQHSSALGILNDLATASGSALMEDFRFNAQRNEALFTLLVSEGSSSEAYQLFEQLNSHLDEQGYEVSYSANQDNDQIRARFKAVKGGA
ncbi:type II secretion system protein GspL [Reinekea thalattae]|uniref:Type II secretion system protein L n=1 Tax=Reinekea thalattae TaxID=2593301 RepID=A0A5C8Z8L4_9GAMM|nr:type II secretion system protein GspL [Reinekea thalattae]TXR53501.1 hypothetical protein FME95_02735 [Reinekea thalattae]